MSSNAFFSTRTNIQRLKEHISVLDLSPATYSGRVMRIYSVRLQKAERAVERVAEVHSYQMQAEEIDKAGIVFAVNTMGNSKPSPPPQMGGKSNFCRHFGLSYRLRWSSFEQGTHWIDRGLQGHAVVREAVAQADFNAECLKEEVKQLGNGESSLNIRLC